MFITSQCKHFFEPNFNIYAEGSHFGVKLSCQLLCHFRFFSHLNLGKLAIPFIFPISILFLFEV